jgi:hypothetical protein
MHNNIENTCWSCDCELKPTEYQRKECLACFADKDGPYDNDDSGEDDE